MLFLDCIQGKTEDKLANRIAVSSWFAPPYLLWSFLTPSPPPPLFMSSFITRVKKQWGQCQSYDRASTDIRENDCKIDSLLEISNQEIMRPCINNEKRFYTYGNA